MRGYRKFIVALATLACATVLVALDKITAEWWATVVLGIGAAYKLTNLGVHWTGAVHARDSTTPRSEDPGGPT